MCEVCLRGDVCGVSQEGDVCVMCVRRGCVWGVSEEGMCVGCV